jgi:hypothetical protein
MNFLFNDNDILVWPISKNFPQSPHAIGASSGKEKPELEFDGAYWCIIAKILVKSWERKCLKKIKLSKANYPHENNL